MQRASNLILTCLMLLSVFPQPGTASTTPEKLAKWSAGKRIKVTLTTGDKLIGRLGTIESDSFVLDPDNRLATRQILQFKDVRSVSTKMTTAKKWVIAGCVYAGLVVMGSML